MFPIEVIVVLCIYAVMSAVTAITYAADKRLATSGRRRIRERTLHVLELVGGWPGALIAQRLFRHKRQKASFFLVTWGTGVVHLAAWGWIAMHWR
ncbi:MAG: DUF1294 domain-containing protein [Anaerolineae bacterium]|nr:DUF1294 domain-containing protein [Phycisphaerae bacterium]